MRRLRIYSDDSYGPSGILGVRDMVTAGVALDEDKASVRELLLDLERSSGKGTRDWHSTRHDPDVRHDYILGALQIRPLVGRCFFARRSIPQPQHAEMRLDTLAAAIAAYSENQRQYRYDLVHEGVASQARYQLRSALLQRGARRLEVLAGDMERQPETRLADAMAGYLRIKLMTDDSDSALLLPEVPDWLLDLG